MTTTTTPRILVEPIGAVSVVTFAETELISEHVISEIMEQLTALADVLPTSDVLIDFHGVRLMSSSMLGVLLKFSRRMAALQGRVKLCRVAPHLLEIFRITRFDRLFEIHDEESTALDSF